MTSVVLTSVNEFIDLALVVTIILIIYYIYRFATFQSKEELEKEKSAGEEFRTKITEKITKSKEDKTKKKEQEKRRKLLGPAKVFVIQAEQVTEKLINNPLTSKTLFEEKKAKGLVLKIEHNLKSAKRILYALLRRKSDTIENLSEHREMRESMKNLYNYTESILKEVDMGLIRNLPKHTDNDTVWDNKRQAVLNSGSNVTKYCGILIEAIDDLIAENSKPNLTSIPSTISPYGPGPYGHRRRP